MRGFHSVAGFELIHGSRGLVTSHAAFAELNPDWQDCLSLADQHRVARRVVAEDARDLALSLSAQRHAISLLTGTAPVNVNILHSETGVPMLDDGFGLKLSLSRTQGASCVAINTQGRTIGVDIEKIRCIEHGPMLRMICEETELEQLEPMMRGEGGAIHFLKLWTLKEAALKAIGQGLRAGAKNVTVTPHELTSNGLGAVTVFGRRHDAILMQDDGNLLALVSATPQDDDRATAIESGEAS